MDDVKKMNKTQRINWGYATDAMRQVEHDLHDVVKKRCMIPDEWHEIWHDSDRRDPVRRRVTMRMDADVIKFFKAMGEGYQHRINRVLRAYMHHRLAGLVQGPDTTDYVLRPENVVSGQQSDEKKYPHIDFDALREDLTKRFDRIHQAHVRDGTAVVHDPVNCRCPKCAPGGP